MMERTTRLTQSPSESGTLLGEEIALSALAEAPVVGLSAIHEMTAFSKNRIFYGICFSSSSESTKVITVDRDFNLVEGVIITVKFINACAGDQYAKKYINVNQTGAYPIAQSISTYNFLDIAADTIHNFVFANDRWVQIDYHRASGTDYGLVMLEDSPNASYDASWGRAATPKALYNLGQQKQNLLVSGTNIKTINNQSILGSGNIEVQGGGASSADEVSYENASSGLSAENVQDAIDELADEKVDKEAGKGLFSGSYDDLTNRPQIPSIPSGTNNGDILVWDASQNKYVSKPKWQMIYQPVEYIEATGTQWINTGLKGADGVDIDFEIIQNVQTDVGASVFSSREEHGSANWYGLEHFTWNGFFIARFSQVPESRGIPELYQTLSRHQLRYGTAFENKIYVDGEYYSVHSSVKQYSSPTSVMCLFKNALADKDKAKARIYSARFYIGSTLARDLIPVRNVSDGSIGMYDKTEGKFYGNNGSGTFLKGADV